MELVQKEINLEWRGRGAKIWSGDRRGIKFSTSLSSALPPSPPHLGGVFESTYVSVLTLSATATPNSAYVHTDARSRAHVRAYISVKFRRAPITIDLFAITITSSGTLATIASRISIRKSISLRTSPGPSRESRSPSRRVSRAAHLYL